MSVFFVRIAVNTDGRLTHVEANADEKTCGASCWISAWSVVRPTAEHRHRDSFPVRRSPQWHALSFW